jgi:hypothetical protein
MSCSRRASWLLLVFAASCFLPAHAAESYDNCSGFIDSVPAVIDGQGTWCLRGDLSTSVTSGFAILVQANNVTIDCNDFKIGGLAAGAATATVGISVPSHFNATIRNCNIRGFRTGILTDGGGGHLIEDNSLDGNTRTGLAIQSPASAVRNNIILDTGGSTSIDGATGIYAAADVDVIGNTINGVMTLDGDSGSVRGIESGSGSGHGGSSTGNRVRGLAPGGTEAIGILSVTGTIIRDNDLQGSGAGSVGILCFDASSTSHDNVVSGFETGIETCESNTDTIVP